MTAVIHHGDCLDVLRELADNSVDAVVCDPPYGLEFMGKEWDAPWKTGNGFRRAANAADADRDNVFGRQSRRGPEYIAGFGFQQWCEQWATEALRVLKPGGHMLAFGGTRTWHRLACAVEDAGFEMRDSIAWLYGSGFPKSLDVSKAIDKAAGATREVVGVKTTPDGKPYTDRRPRNADGDGWDRPWKRDPDAWTAQQAVTAPATPDAERWQGWGTALKPAFEPIVVARKPLGGTVAANVLEWGTGAMNVDGCRVATSDDLNGGAYTAGRQPRAMNPNGAGAVNVSDLGEYVQPAGRWPTNVLLDGSQADALDEQSGTLTSGKASRDGHVRRGDANRSVYGTYDGQGRGDVAGELYGDSGGASRFFPTFRYQAKAPTRERIKVDGVAHPTVKPLALMRWLVRLVTPPGGVVLDPFAGSGTTIEAAILEGFRVIGIEREADYLPLIEARIARATPGEQPSAAEALALFDLEEPA